MNVAQLIETGHFDVLHRASDLSGEITDVFCCDLLSIAMAKGIPGAAFVTVMGNVNALAVLRLTDMRLLVLAEGIGPDEATLKKAKDEDITILSSREGIFPCAQFIHERL